MKENLLFIGIGFHRFDEYIIEDLSRRYNVYYVCSRAFINEHPYLNKILTIISHRLQDYLTERKIKKQLEAINGHLSKLFVIKGECLKAKHLDFICSCNNFSRKVLYLWDSWDNHSNLNEITPYFDEIYSFDSKDCRERGLVLRPLFYFQKRIKRSNNREYDMSFIGGGHSSRYEFLRKMKFQCLSRGWRYSFHLLIGKVAFFKYTHCNFFFPHYYKEDSDILIGQPLSYSEYVDIVSKSKVMLDMQATGQTGLTMRTIEALAMGARLITTNECITEYEDIPRDAYLLLSDRTSEKEIVNFVKKSNEPFGELSLRYESSNALNEMI